ncbi:MAG TPA: 2-dehydropantoate 2-reductase N-terminal domain-containing protein [Burkholderiales bacterium]|nr:2-dehydropantoate 2-reductase N-terminal domain-containing protein [Burkholderiales bacterium]
MQKKIAVLGAGAMGSCVSADLTKAGLDVTVIDQWPQQVEALKTKGLRIQMIDGVVETPINALHLCELSSANLEFDIVFMCCKSNDHRWMAELIKPYLKKDGVLTAIQNGMNDDALGSILGRERVVGCVVELSSEIFTPGLVKRNTGHKTTWMSIGELDGFYTDRVKELEAILSNVGRCDVTNNIYGAKWTKLIANTMTMGPFGLLGLGNKDASALPGMFDVSLSLGRESLAVGKALGHRIEPIFGLRADEFAGTDEENLVAAMKQLLEHVTNGRTAPIHDHMKGRTSEMEFIPGLVAREGKRLGIATPYNDAVVEIDRMINRHEIPMDASNFELLQSKVR